MTTVKIDGKSEKYSRKPSKTSNSFSIQKHFICHLNNASQFRIFSKSPSHFCFQERSKHLRTQLELEKKTKAELQRECEDMKKEFDPLKLKVLFCLYLSNLFYFVKVEVVCLIIDPTHSTRFACCLH